MPSVLDLVRHYQHGIEKYPQDHQRVLRYIDKLFRLDVTVGHLQETGIGRTVNALRKETGDVGKAARALVYKWKLMVAAEESDEDEDHVSKATTTTTEQSNGKNTDDPKAKQAQHQPNSTPLQPQQHGKINGDSGSKRKHQEKEDEEPVVKKQRSSFSSEDEHTRKRIKTEQSESDSEDSSDSLSDNSDSGSDNEPPNVHGHTVKHIKTESPEHTKTERHTHSNHKQDDYKHSKVSDESSEKYSKHSSESRPVSAKTDTHHSSKDKSAKKNESSSQKVKEHREKNHKTEVTPDKDKQRKEEKHSKHSSEKHGSTSHSHKGDSGSERSRDKHRSKLEKDNASHRTEKEQLKSSDVETRSDKHTHESKESSSEHKAKESSSSKEHKSKDSSSSSKDKSSSSKDKSRDKSSSSKEKSRSHSDKSDRKSSSDKSKSDSKSKDRVERSGEMKSSDKPRSSSHKSSSSKSKDIPKKKLQDGAEDSDEGIDCESGASFAEALGMVIPAKPKKKSTPVKESYLQPGSGNSSNNDLSPAALLAPSTKLAPLPALEISALPDISPNYKPRPPPKCLPHFDEDAMNCVISSKNQRTKVYSGNKVLGKVPSLYELCVHILQEHIDALEYTGGVPYEILKPVIDKATPQQLFMLEHYNAYLIEDTDHLWQRHVEKHFRNKKREEMETWREMYMRCQEEQENKLKSLTENIKLTQEAKKAPIKQTKMAYVDSVVKPPRNIARKQALHGTKFAAAASPAARVAALATAPNVLRGGVRPSPAAPVSPAALIRPKKAPLMQKALQFMRGRKR